jgi:peroxiredoxin
LKILYQSGDRQLVPIVFPRLDDPDPRVVISADAALRKWTGLISGMRQFHALPQFHLPAVMEPRPWDIAGINEGVKRWKEWWQVHQSNYPAHPATNHPAAANWRLPASDFVLEDLDQAKVRLSDFKGKVVLLDFWDTVTPACLQEIPVRNELQQRYTGRLIILGISLESTTAKRGHEHGCAHEGKSFPQRDIAAVRAQVRQIVQSEKIAYRILVDPNDSAARRFSVEALPTCVLIDAEGYIRRRFIGRRTLTVFEAMISEITGPP